jgi:hypothetical protein
LQRITNAEGLVSANWKLGPSGGQNVEVIVKRKDGTPAEGSPVVFTASVGKEGDLAKLILGTWREVKWYGMEGDEPFYRPNDGEDQYYWIFENDGELVERVFEYQVWYTDKLFYKIDEERKLLGLLNPLDSDYDGQYNNYQIIDLNISKLVIYTEWIYEGVKETYYAEYERISEIPNLKTNKVAPGESQVDSRTKNKRKFPSRRIPK